MEKSGTFEFCCKVIMMREIRLKCFFKSSPRKSSLSLVAQGKGKIILICLKHIIVTTCTSVCMHLNYN